MGRVFLPVERHHNTGKLISLNIEDYRKFQAAYVSVVARKGSGADQWFHPEDRVITNFGEDDELCVRLV